MRFDPISDQAGETVGVAVEAEGRAAQVRFEDIERYQEIESVDFRQAVREVAAEALGGRVAPARLAKIAERLAEYYNEEREGFSSETGLAPHEGVDW